MGFEAPGWCRGEEEKVLLASFLSCRCCFQLTLVTKPGAQLKFSVQARLWVHMQRKGAGVGAGEHQPGCTPAPRALAHGGGQQLSWEAGRGGTNNREGGTEGGSPSSSSKLLGLTFQSDGSKPLARFVSGSDSPWHQREQPPGQDELLCLPPRTHASV